MSAEPIHVPPPPPAVHDRGFAWRSLWLTCGCAKGRHRIELWPSLDPAELGGVERVVVVSATAGHSLGVLPEVARAAADLAAGAFPAGLDLSGLEAVRLPLDHDGLPFQAIRVSGKDWHHLLRLTPWGCPVVVREEVSALVRAPDSGRVVERPVIRWPRHSTLFEGDLAMTIAQGLRGNPRHIRASMAVIGSYQALQAHRVGALGPDDLRQDTAALLAAVVSAFTRTAVVTTADAGADAAWAWPTFNTDGGRAELVRAFDASVAAGPRRSHAFRRVCRRIAVAAAPRTTRGVVHAAAERIVVDDRGGCLSPQEVVALDGFVKRLHAVPTLDRVSLVVVVPPTTALPLRRGVHWVYEG